MSEIKWHEVEQNQNNDGIVTMALLTEDEEMGWYKTVGYNGILKGDQVTYKDEKYTVVMVSRLGHFGLSNTGKLPYTLSVLPKEVTA